MVATHINNYDGTQLALALVPGDAVGLGHHPNPVHLVGGVDFSPGALDTGGGVYIDVGRGGALLPGRRGSRRGWNK